MRNLLAGCQILFFFVVGSFAFAAPAAQDPTDILLDSLDRYLDEQARKVIPDRSAPSESVPQPMIINPPGDAPSHVNNDRFQPPTPQYGDVLPHSENHSNSSKRPTPSRIVDQLTVIHRLTIPFPSCGASQDSSLPLQTRRFHLLRPSTGLFRTLSSEMQRDPQSAHIYKLIILSVSQTVQRLLTESLKENLDLQKTLRVRLDKSLAAMTGSSPDAQDGPEDALQFRGIDTLHKLAVRARQELALSRGKSANPVSIEAISESKKLLPLDFSINVNLEPVEEDLRTKKWDPVVLDSAEWQKIRDHWYSETDKIRRRLRELPPTLPGATDGYFVWRRKHYEIAEELDRLRSRHLFKYRAYLTVAPLLRFIQNPDFDDFDLVGILEPIEKNTRELLHRETVRTSRLESAYAIEPKDIEVLDFIPVVENWMQGRQAELCPYLVSLYYHRTNRDLRKAIPLQLGGLLVFSFLPLKTGLALGLGWAAWDYAVLLRQRQRFWQGAIAGGISVNSSQQVLDLDSALNEYVVLTAIQMTPMSVLGSFWRVLRLSSGMGQAPNFHQ